MLRVLCVAPSLTSRAIREMAVLANRGNVIDLLYWGIGYNVMGLPLERIFNEISEINKTGSKFEHYTLLSPMKFRRSFIKFHKEDYDIIHTYSNFDTLTIAAKKYTEIPVVYDVRDMTSLFSTETHLRNYLPPKFRSNRLLKFLVKKTIISKIMKNEKRAFEGSDGVVFTSDYMLDIATRIRHYTIRNYTILPNYVPASFLPNEWPDKFSNYDGKIHIAYEGYLSLRGYRDILPILKNFISPKTVIHVYGSGTKEAIQKYKELSMKEANFRYEGDFPFTQLIYELSRNDVGLIPFTMKIDKLHIHSILPNKLFDYLVAGLPVLSTPSKSIVKFLKEENVGGLFNPDKIHEMDVPSLLERLLKLKIEREKYTMENHINKLEKLYKKIM